MEGENLYVGTQDRDVRALDAESGNTVWDFDLRGDDDANKAVYGTPAISNGIAYVGGYNGTLYALDLEDGRDVWDKPVGDGSPIVGGATVGEGLVVVGSSDGALYAFDATDGSPKWSFPTGNSIWATPIVADGKIIFGSMDHKVYALNLDGQKLWEFATGGAVTAEPLVTDGGRVYVGSFSSDFFALDAETGSMIWKFPDANNWYWSRAVTNGETLFVGSTDGNLYALDADSGRLRWIFPTNGSILGSPALVVDRVAVGSTDGRVRLVRQQDGQDETQCNIGAAIKSRLSAQGNFLYFRADDRSIRALEISPNGNPDEIWVHRSDQDDAVSRDWTRSC